jgi:chemotaxis protein CheD
MSPHVAWVIPPPKKTLVVGVADMLASNDAGADLVTYSLGSCLGVAIYDPVRKVGGLLHVMLPESKIDPQKATIEPCMFVDTGLPRLFHAVYGLGGDRSRLKIKIAGGAQFLDDKRFFNIGERNYDAATAVLARNGFTMDARAVGGSSSRTMRLNIATGEVKIQSPGVDPYLL